MFDLNLFQLLILIIAINLGIILYTKVKRGFLKDPVYNGLLAADLGLMLYSFQSSVPANSLAAWLGMGIFIFAVIVPAFINRFIASAVYRYDWSRAAKLLQMKYIFQPSTEVAAQIKHFSKLMQANKGEVVDISGDLEKQLHQTQDPIKRMLIAESLVELYVFSGKWQKALDFYDDNLDEVQFVTKPGIYVSLMKASFEIADYEAMWNFYEKLDTNSDDPLVKRAVFSAHTIILATYGKPGILKKALFPLDSNDSFFPPALRRYWYGTALLNDNKIEKARNALTFPEKLAENFPVYDKLSRQRLQAGPVSTPELSRDCKEELRKIKSEYRGLAVSKIKSRLLLTTWFFLIFNSLVFIGQHLLGDPSNIINLYKLGGNFRALSLDTQWWRNISAMFLHANFIHIFFNLYIIWIFGRMLEPHYGRIRSWVIIIFSGISGNVLSTIMYKEGVSIGFSSSVFGVIGAVMVMLVAYKNRFPEEWRKKQFSFLLVMLGLNVALGFSVKMIDNAAHIGGFMGGVVVSFILGAASERNFIQTFLSRFLFLVSLILMVYTGLQIYQTSQGENFNNYRLDRMGITFKYPAHWNHRQVKDKLNYSEDEHLQVFYSRFCQGYNVFFLLEGSDAVNYYNSLSQNQYLLSSSTYGKWKELKGKVEDVYFLYYFIKIKGQTVGVRFEFEDNCQSEIMKNRQKILSSIKFIN